MCNIPIKVSAHTSINSSKGVIRSMDLEGVREDGMLDNLSSQGVSAVKTIHIRRNNELVPTNIFILTFCKPLLPDSIKAGYLKIPVVPFIPNPLRCFKCHRYGHGENACRGKATCSRCGQVDHESKTCNRKEGNVLFNDALNTFYLRLYGVRHMVKDHTDIARGNPLPSHGLLFPINSKGYFICTIPQTGLHIPRPLLHQSRSTGWNEK